MNVHFSASWPSQATALLQTMRRFSNMITAKLEFKMLLAFATGLEFLQPTGEKLTLPIWPKITKLILFTTYLEPWSHGYSPMTVSLLISQIFPVLECLVITLDHVNSSY